MDIKSIGAGGGSIAWMDDAGALNVGPHSAGAEPGPICYRKGGTEPTVTDANLILGRIAPNRFLGGSMNLDYESAKKSLQDKIGAALGWDSVKAARGIFEISLANMALLVREMTINRGYDPRDFTLMSFGGAGGLYANEVAKELGLRVASIVPIDLDFRKDGSTIIERKKKARNPHVIAEKALKLVRDGKLETIDGVDKELKVDILLVHGDGPNSTDIFKEIRSVMAKSGVKLRPFTSFI